MIKYNFDEVIDRRGTHAVKLDGMQEIWGRTDLIPLWVADMDFATPPFILEAVRKRCELPFWDIRKNRTVITGLSSTG